MIVIPTLAELFTSVKSDLETKFGDSIPAFGKIFLYALCGVQAAKLKLYYLVIAILQKNIFADTAEPESTGGTLERFGRVKLGRSPFPATAAQYTVEVTGTIGATIRTGTTFKSNDDTVNPERLFIIDSDFTLETSPDEITIRALEAGLDSQMSVDEELTITIPVPGVDRTVTVVAELIAPLAAEDIEDYREKTLNAFRTEPNGGAASDYRLWADDAQGVEKVYPYAKTGATAEINLYVEATTVDSTDGKGTPSAAILLAVEEVIEFDPDTTKPLNERGRRPLGVFQINYLPITVKEIVITIPDYVNLTAETEALIEAALEEMISEVRPFVAGADILTDRNDILSLNKIIATIIAAKPGSIFGSVEMTVGGSSLTSFQFTLGDIPHLDSVVFS